ncbi:MAG: soluble lytic murein transglycosylase [Candidatus Tokpelaia sp. JSC085]|nr:MAG: soluble lytic murein transglycosylase [Candidatus Tokpelaia sp. JSC085]
MKKCNAWREIPVIQLFLALTGGLILSLFSIAHAQDAHLRSEDSLSYFFTLPTPKPGSRSFISSSGVPVPGPVRPYTNVLPEKLQSGFDALKNRQIERAIALRDTMPISSLERNTMTWAIVTSDTKEVPASQFRQAMTELKKWPGQVIIRRNFERALARENNVSPQEVISFFTDKKPLTADGMAVYGAALIACGLKEQAYAIVAPWWQKVKLDEREEQLIINKIGTILTHNDHKKRLQAVLYAYRLNSAERIAQLAGATSVYRGIAAVVHKNADAGQKLDAVDPTWQKQPIYTFARIQHLRHTGRYEEAVQLMLNTPEDAAALTDPDAWWIERRVLSREMLDSGQPKAAYQLAATHSAKSPIMRVDAEFHAGWYALCFLNNPETAMLHFSRVIKLSSYPVSAARGFYWMGRAAESMSEKDKARTFFQQAARYSTTFYGQLAASRLGTRKLKISYPRPTMEDRKRFESREPVKAIKCLEAASYRKEAIFLYHALANQLKNPGELALLALMAERHDDYHTSLKIGKNAVQRGITVGSLSYPLGAIPGSADLSVIGQALAYAVARQESEFNPSALSNANARGMLQLLPETAKDIALRRGLSYSIQELSNNPSYNATLGAYFLGEQLKQFHGSYILTLIGYNAGSHRANEWIARYGDPRHRSVDEVVDWIERIPYSETRNYVQRVMESYEVYKTRFIGDADIKNDLVNGRQH